MYFKIHIYPSHENSHIIKKSLPSSPKYRQYLKKSKYTKSSKGRIVAQQVKLLSQLLNDSECLWPSS